MLTTKDLFLMKVIILQCESVEEVCEYCELFTQYINELLPQSNDRFQAKEYLRREANSKIYSL